MSLCFLHRSEYAHKCVNKDMNDMTSMDCPVCNKSFKLTKAEDPNEAWDRHYSTACSQVPGSSKAKPLQCSSTSCKVTLGPSNRFLCPLCRSLVCLSCRTPEAHQCSAAAPLRGKSAVSASRAAKLSQSNSNSSHNVTRENASRTTRMKGSSSSSSSARSRGGSGGSEDNTLKGSAQRRMLEHQARLREKSTASGQQPVGVSAPPVGHTEGGVGVNESSHRTSSTTEGTFICPMCSNAYSAAVDLVQHVDRAHNESTLPTLPSRSSHFSSAASSSMTSSSATNNGISDSGEGVGLSEECPTCSQRFPDVMSLIQHAETQHTEVNSNRNCLLS